MLPETILLVVVIVAFIWIVPVDWQQMERLAGQLWNSSMEIAENISATLVSGWESSIKDISLTETVVVPPNITNITNSTINITNSG